VPGVPPCMNECMAPDNSRRKPEIAGSQTYPLRPRPGASWAHNEYLEVRGPPAAYAISGHGGFVTLPGPPVQASCSRADLGLSTTLLIHPRVPSTPHPASSSKVGPKEFWELSGLLYQRPPPSEPLCGSSHHLPCSREAPSVTSTLPMTCLQENWTRIWGRLRATGQRGARRQARGRGP
jgi:hypothetical protein